ncbi:MAG: STAS domain-containing protein [Candidatus Omnitrophica bacterium]|nr:STAS domain-containing protein [Candidatus Omnitrophota bacterium]
MVVKTVGDVKVMEVVSRFDAYTAGDVEKVLMGLIDNGAKKILCDFSQTEYISSIGLSVLLSVAKRLQKVGGELVLCSLKSFVLQVFEMTSFTKIFKIYKSQEEALKSITSP